MAVTLALDLGSTTGWALELPGGDKISGSQSFKPDRYSGAGMRFLRFRGWLDELHSTYPVDVLYYEEVRRHAGVDAAHCYGGFMAHLQAWAESSQVPYAGIPVGTIKKYATGKGNANKEAMMQAMIDKGHRPVDDNEADAIALLYYSLTLSQSVN